MKSEPFCEMTASDEQIRRDFERAVGHHQARQFSEAEALYEKILKSRPRNSAVLNLLGVIRCQRGDCAGGISLLERSIGIEKARGTYRNLGLALQIEGRLDDAVAAYRGACDLEPQNPEARLELGSMLLQAGRPVEALVELRETVDSKYPPAEPGALGLEPLKAACPRFPTQLSSPTLWKASPIHQYTEAVPCRHPCYDVAS
jgi:Tfp pilus assembly protein PilF